MKRGNCVASALLLCGACSNLLGQSDEVAPRDRALPVTDLRPTQPGDPSAPVNPNDPSKPVPTNPDPGTTDPTDPPGTTPPTTPCGYPSTSGGFNRTGDVIPPMAWNHARLPTGAITNFDLEEFHCADDGFHGVVFLLSAGWCGNCPTYMRDLAPDVSEIERRGLKVALVLMENSNSQSASDADAAEYGDQYFDGSVLRLGDADTSPAGVLYSSSVWSSFPGALVVRKSDMTLYANQDEQGQTLDFLRIANDLAASSGNPPTPDPACSEEAGEPNNDIAHGTVLSTTASAAVCDGAPDHWQVTGTGSVFLSVHFSNAAGDLDLMSVDASGRVLEKSEGNTDTETLTIDAPGRFAIYGYEGALGPYTITVTR